MAKATYQENFRVVVDVDYNHFFSRVVDARIDQKQTAEELVEQIRRHCDGVDTITVEYDTIKQCQYCEAQWTEVDDQYNGGCCGEDQKAVPVQQRLTP